MPRLVDLKITDVKSELEERECDTAGKKAELQERLHQALGRRGPGYFHFYRCRGYWFNAAKPFDQVRKQAHGKLC
ncbi:unnamed protein product [Acanthoscelides obtectus]|uniref:SAP domain-containing protein n=1 Tax=Acanthoscelides obtectus TaxID=200917 RepID=A0A9P0JXX3_ACAOB|nr:unnamed protein product [Acanthoscelides obtectus]CAK1642254.1 hypothetical protein AOBTE_LOCUS12924 [Acanthoscelides obtectus]